jgi:hypothetical protein
MMRPIGRAIPTKPTRAKYEFPVPARPLAAARCPSPPFKPARPRARGELAQPPVGGVQVVDSLGAINLAASDSLDARMGLAQ